MELYILDDQLRRTEVIDQFESLIWTERYSESGDFQLDIHSDSTARSLLQTDTYVAINESYRMMKIDTLEDKDNDDGTSTLTVTGKSIENILMDRTAMPALTGTNATPKWNLTGTPASIAQTMFNIICVGLALDPGDSIPFYHYGSLRPQGQIIPSQEIITASFDPDTLYNSIKTLCDTYNLGFRILRNFDKSELYFDIYTGNDRTTAQTRNDAVIFSRDLGNLSGTSRLSSTAALKNVANVFSPNGSTTVYAEDIDPTIAGFQRHVLTVNATDIDPSLTGSDLMLALQQRGVQELAQNRITFAFDGEIPQNSSYKYGFDYNLGDLVEIRDKDGVANYMRVTEQILVSDSQGDRSYPTLAVDTIITPGSWAAYGNDFWADVDDAIEWVDLP